MATKTMVIGVRGSKAADEVVVPNFQPDVKNRFGNMLIFKGALGVPAMIDNCLTATPKTPAAIAKETGLSEKRVLEHLEYWTLNREKHLKAGKTLGLVLQKNEAGYFVTG